MLEPMRQPSVTLAIACVLVIAGMSHADQPPTEPDAQPELGV